MGSTTGRDPADRLAHVGTVRAPVALAMPARRARWERVQVNARVRVEIEHVLQRFVRDHDTPARSCAVPARGDSLPAGGSPPTDQVARAVMADVGEGPS